MGLDVGSEESPEVKLGLMIKNAKVIKAVRLLEPLVEDLKKLTVDDSNTDRDLGFYKDVKDIMIKCSARYSGQLSRIRKERRGHNLLRL